VNCATRKSAVARFATISAIRSRQSNYSPTRIAPLQLADGLQLQQKHGDEGGQRSGKTCRRRTRYRLGVARRHRGPPANLRRLPGMESREVPFVRVLHLGQDKTCKRNLPAWQMVTLSLDAGRKTSPVVGPLSDRRALGGLRLGASSKKTVPDAVPRRGPCQGRAHARGLEPRKKISRFDARIAERW